jgi:hypothetical protein
MRRLMMAAVVTAAAVLPAAAQEPPRTRERSFTFTLGPEGFFGQRRGRLGIIVDLTADASRDSIGARVAGVTPGGAADRAGVRTGDVVVRLNGTRLASSAVGREDEEHEDQSAPGHRLIRLASRLDPGDTVRLELRRDGRTETVTFVAEESDVDRIVTRLRPGLEGIRELITIPGPGRREFSFGGFGFRDLELVKVSPQLAEGLGISEGLLVVDVGTDTILGLRAGDVILAIGGRRPTSAAHALRILSTYDPQEAVQFDVMRRGRRQAVSGRMPEARARWRVEPNGFQMLMPRLELPRREWRFVPRIKIEAPLVRVVRET